MSDAIAVAVVALGTYASRATFIVTLADRELPELARRAMRTVGPAVLSALVGSLMVGEQGIAGLQPSIEWLALTTSGLVAWKTRNVVAALAAGMISLWLLAWWS